MTPVDSNTRSDSVLQAVLPCDRVTYEGVGGWNDGRLGQVFDLLADVIEDRGEKVWRHPLLTQIEAMDSEMPLPTPPALEERRG